MSIRKPFAALALALTLAWFSPAFAANEHEHGGHGAAAIELTLNNGQKWPADEALLLGMSEMRNLLATSLDRVQAGRFAADDYVALADRLQAQVDYVTANCKLPEEADAQLHIVLVEVLEALEVMRSGAERAQGVLRAVVALEAYGRHFDHPNWASIAR